MIERTQVGEAVLTTYARVDRAATGKADFFRLTGDVAEPITEAEYNTAHKDNPPCV